MLDYNSTNVTSLEARVRLSLPFSFSSSQEKRRLIVARISRPRCAYSRGRFWKISSSPVRPRNFSGGGKIGVKALRNRRIPAASPADSDGVNGEKRNRATFYEGGTAIHNATVPLCGTLVRINAVHV